MHSSSPVVCPVLFLFLQKNAQEDDDDEDVAVGLQEELMRETESGFVVGDGDDAAEFMNFEMGHDSEDEENGEGKKKKKKRGALNAAPKRKKEVRWSQTVVDLL